MTQSWETFLGGAEDKSRGRSTDIEYTVWLELVDLGWQVVSSDWKGQLPVSSPNLLDTLPCGSDLIVCSSCLPECKPSQGRTVSLSSL